MANELFTSFPPTHRDSSVVLESANVGKVGLTVSDLQRSLDFYAGAIGLDVLSQTSRSAQLGVAADARVLFELEQLPNVRPLRARRLGLYHTALLLPSRSALASFAEHLHQRGIGAGSSDHLVSEAFYLEDPDGLTIEVYADREREFWPWRGKELDAAVLPLDLGKLLATPHPRWNGVPHGTGMGHMHLYIGDLQAAEQLYRHGLGMNVRTRSIPGALFLAAGDYHHHVGLNTWAGPVPPASEHEARLCWWELNVPLHRLSALRVQALSVGWQPGQQGSLVDPWGISLRLTANV